MEHIHSQLVSYIPVSKVGRLKVSATLCSEMYVRAIRMTAITMLDPVLELKLLMTYSRPLAELSAIRAEP